MNPIKRQVVRHIPQLSRLVEQRNQLAHEVTLLRDERTSRDEQLAVGALEATHLREEISRRDEQLASRDDRLAAYEIEAARLHSELASRNEQLAAQVADLAIWKQATWPPGHYYSPSPSLRDVRARHAQIFHR
ncbi:MAG: hypothetical protein ACLQLC_02625, partial [Candidatus Sulfotelmatobacter sp.]